jgi:hypothetical protein
MGMGCWEEYEGLSECKEQEAGEDRLKKELQG